MFINLRDITAGEKYIFTTHVRRMNEYMNAYFAQTTFCMSKTKYRIIYLLLNFLYKNGASLKVYPMSSF